jgi:hypothetical protein
LPQSEFYLSSNTTHVAFTPNDFLYLLLKKWFVENWQRSIVFLLSVWKQCIGTGDAQSYLSSSFAGAPGSHRLSSSTRILATSPLRSGLLASKFLACKWPRRVSRSVKNCLRNCQYTGLPQGPRKEITFMDFNAKHYSTLRKLISNSCQDVSKK